MSVETNIIMLFLETYEKHLYFLTLCECEDARHDPAIFALILVAMIASHLNHACLTRSH